ncbi:hypothetical protein [Pseudomonas fluorescens]|uniref:Uncharacterized protein n=1 Tax=Pseudomonas fluorescens TaxID=294 RepID=A0A5E7E4N1_PSEFL|nr:hypothetical protein [Pseudomonas fluorescens]VVO21618.1 hypothetical protein PS723_04255 [Pseudomonas fluorescens]
MNPDEDTCEWLGIPTPLETCIQHTHLLENEIDNLNQQLRAARENIFKLVEMQAQTTKDRDQAREYLKEKAATLAELREQLRDLKSASNVQVREIDELRDQVARLRGVDPRQE